MGRKGVEERPEDIYILGPSWAGDDLTTKRLGRPMGIGKGKGDKAQLNKANREFFGMRFKAFVVWSVAVVPACFVRAAVEVQTVTDW